MRDRDAAALLREILELLGNADKNMTPARSRLRTWRADGYPPGRGADGAGSSSGEGHADPVARTVQALEVTGPGPEHKHRGWRDDDPFGKRLADIDRRLFDIRERALDLTRELAELVTDPADPGEDGCTLCNAVRLAIGHECECRMHKDCASSCDVDCRCRCVRTDHRHPASHQPIHNRRAPKPAFDGDDPVEDLPRCQFHYEFAGRYGVDAHPTINRWHLDHPGAHIPLTLIREHHSAAYARLTDQRRQGATA